MKRLGSVVLLAVAAASRTQAQIPPPAVTCEVADFSMTLSLYLPLSRDGTGSVGEQGMQGSLEIHHQKVPKESRRWSLDGKRPAQFWNQGDELKILVVLGTAEDRITLAIDTLRRPSDSEHIGSFRLNASAVRLSGRLACRD